MWGALEKSDFKVHGSWGGGETAWTRGQRKSTMVLHFCKVLGSSTPVLQEQTRGLGSQHGGREVSECSGHKGYEMLQDSCLHLTLCRAAAQLGTNILCTVRYKPRQPRQRAEALAGRGVGAGGEAKVGGLAPTEHRSPRKLQLTNSFPVQGRDFLRS